jgi:hypothetical protein
MGRSGKRQKMMSGSKTLTRSSARPNQVEAVDQAPLNFLFKQGGSQVGDQVVGFFERFSLDKKRRFKMRLKKIKELSNGSASEQIQAESLIKDSVEELAQITSLIDNPEAKAAVDEFLKPYLEVALTTLKNKTNQDLSQLTNAETLRLARWQESINQLKEEGTVNAQNAERLLNEANGAGNWLNKRLTDTKIMDPANDPAEKESLHLQIKIIEGVLAVARDPELNEIDRSVRNQEEQIRLEAAVQGEVPDRSMLVLPTPETLGVPPRHSAPAHHCYSSGKEYGETNKYIFLYADPIIDGSGDRTNGTSFAKEDVISFARHELIHAGQVNIFGADRKYRRAAKEAGLNKARDQEDLAEHVKESLTEGLNITRGFKPNSNKSFDRAGINNTDCSYREELLVLAEVFDIIGLDNSQREETLDLLNSLSAGDVVEFFDQQLKGAGEGFLNLFSRLLKNQGI